MKIFLPIRSIPVWFWAAVLLAAQIAAAMTLGIFLNTRIERAEAFLAETRTAGISTPEAEKYVLREYCGRIGIFTDSQDTPTEVLGVYVFTLPEADRKALEIGIAVFDRDSLRALIEDFTA